MTTETPILLVEDLTMAFGEFLVQKHVSFTVQSGQVFIIMGPSGCGKSTLLKHLTGLQPPASGRVELLQSQLWELESEARHLLLQRTGVLFQNGALWSGMTVAENIALPMHLHTDLSHEQIDDLTALKLALVGLNDAGQQMPSELSGG
ncbi:MAG: ATP-binding cassette domain-containing protein, partial [Natronospirillum sp.]